MVRNRNGAVAERPFVSGRVVHVDQGRHSFTLEWRGHGFTKMEYYYFNYQQTYRVTDGTVYKYGSWANMTKGVLVRITGHSDVAETVVFRNPAKKLSS
jgi:hypothetical protein